jgi:hypothetical protein
VAVLSDIVKVDPTGSLCQTNTEKINLTIWGEFTHNACIKLRPKNKCGYKLFSVFITTVDRSHNKINTSIKIQDNKIKKHLL